MASTAHAEHHPQLARARRPSLQVYLVSLLVVFAAVVVAVLLIQRHLSIDSAYERTDEALTFRAELAASSIDAAVEQTMSTVTALAASPGVRTHFDGPTSTACTLSFGGAGPFAAGHLDVVATDGHVRCSSRAMGVDAVYAGAGWLVAGADAPAVVGPLDDPATDRAVVLVTAPVPGLGAVVAFLEVDALAAELSATLSGPMDTVFALADPVAASSGQAADGDLTASAVVSSLGFEIFTTTVRPPAVSAAEDLNNHLLWYLLGCVAFLGVAVQLVYRGIARPIERLNTSVRAVMAGDASTIVSTTGPAEVVSLAVDFGVLLRVIDQERAERHHAELASATSESEREVHAAMLKSIVQSTQSLIYVKDLDGRYLMVNAAFERAAGCGEADLLGRTDASITPENAPRWSANDLLAREGSIEVEEWGEAPDGMHCFESVKFPLHDSRGQLYAVCGVSLDVTERRATTAAIAEARDAALAANAAKTTFLATMSHEIRTPMTAVIGMTDLLAHSELDAYQHELVDTVQSSGDALLAVINDILDISKIEAGELVLEKASFDLRMEIERCLDLVVAAASKKGLDVICDVDGSCPPQVCGDAVRLRQIATNLLANAVKFTDRGEVLLEVRCDDAGADQVSVQVSVTDTGIGISERSLDGLFESFSQVDASTTRVYGGTGLGLTIAQRLAEAMGGGVAVTSTPGTGSSFTVTVVLAKERGVEDGVHALPSGLAGSRILVVDDNGTSLRVLGEQLARLGMSCTLAGSTAAALALVDGGLAYDVALIDMNMPDRDGRELAELLRSSAGPSAGSPLVALIDVGELATVGSLCAHTVARPVKSTALREAVTAAVTGSARTGQPPRTPAPSPASRPLRVLLAEDHLVNQRVVQLMLTELGHQVDIVDDGGAAVEAVASARYDVVLMDLQMPRMDGLEATRRVRAYCDGGPRPRIIAMTASTFVDDREACVAAGMDAYLGKPVRAVELREMLEQTATLMASG